MEIYFDCQALPFDDEVDGEMALSMLENYIVPSNYCIIPTELLMSHRGENCRSNHDTNQGLMDEIETKTKLILQKLLKTFSEISWRFRTSLKDLWRNYSVISN